MDIQLILSNRLRKKRKIVDIIHSAEHPDGHGTVFTVKLPAGREHLAGRADVIFTDGAEEYSGVLPHLRGIEPAGEAGNEKVLDADKDDVPAILVVEDNSDLRRMLVNMLGERYVVYGAADGNEALKVLEDTGEIDLVLSDVMMPGMDGHELLRRIREDMRFEGLPVILLTARADSFMKVEGLDIGATDYVTKPFNSGELLLRIRNQVELRRLRNSAMRNYKDLVASLKSAGARPISEESASRIEAVCEFMRRHYAQDISREDLAEAAGMNPDTFSRHFNQHTGRTLYEYICELRIAEAKLRLTATDDTVIRISFDVGFDSIRTFNRAFKKITGMNPGEYRGNANPQN